MRKYDFKENRAKFSVAGPGARRIVLGLLVDGQVPRLSRAARSRVEGHLKHPERSAPSGHALARGFRSVDGLKEHVLGLLAYVKQVDVPLYERYRQRFDEVEWPPA